MKLNWFSPLPPARTGIAEYTAQVLPALCARAEVTLWTEQAEWDEALQAHAEVRRYKPGEMRWSELNRADATFYHMGNNPSFHYGIWLTSRRHPGIVVLHDTRLHHFFAGVYRERWRDRDGYVAEMERLYGERGRHTAERFWTTPGGPEHIAETYPLTPLALENSLGALVHTREAFETLRKDARWPLMYAPLPFTARPLKKNGERHKRARVRQSPPAASSPRGVPSPFKLITFGYISPNRRLDALLEALAGMKEKEDLRLDVYGEVWNESYLRERVQSLGLEKVVTLHGFVSDAELDEALDAADLAVNLRFPTMGESSLTQLRIWEHALPTLVTAVGWYRHLPEEAVLFVRPQSEIADIQKHLRALFAAPARLAEMGRRGRRTLEARHSPEVYAESLIAFAARGESLRRRAAAQSLTERVGAELGVWTTRETSSGAFKRVGEAILPFVAGDEKHAPGE